MRAPPCLCRRLRRRLQLGRLPLLLVLAWTTAAPLLLASSSRPPAARRRDDGGAAFILLPPAAFGRPRRPRSSSRRPPSPLPTFARGTARRRRSNPPRAPPIAPSPAVFADRRDGPDDDERGGAAISPEEDRRRSQRRIVVPILYEDESMLAVSKPPGVPHHDDEVVNDSTGRRRRPGILFLVRSLQSSSSPAFPYRGRLHGVHRLDRVTSGVLLFAKDPVTAGKLTGLFRERRVMKYYVGISNKRPKKKKQGWVRGRMVKGRRGGWKLLPTTKKGGGGDGGIGAVADGRDGVWAETRFFSAGLGGLVVDRRDDDAVGTDDDAFAPRTALLFRPYTGRTHQLRVAAKAVGLPLLGDPTYNSGGKGGGNGAGDGPKRTYLHATALHFDLDGRDVTIVSRPPFDHLWESGVGTGDREDDGDGTPGFQSIVDAMMKKHCDCDAILEMLERERSRSSWEG